MSPPLQTKCDVARVLRLSRTEENQVGEVDLGRRVSTLRGNTQPPRRFIFVFRYARAGQI